MFAKRFRRAVLALGVLLASAAFATAALPPAGGPPPDASLAGQLLVAAPEIADMRFHHAVILIVLHNKEGAMGIVINQPVGERPIAALLKAIGEDASGVAGSVRVFAGGPVQPGIGFVLHSAEYHRAETVAIDDRLAITASPEILRDIGHERGPKQALVAFGYAGWAPGQLEGELARHDWVTVPEDPKLVFDDDRAKLWEHAFARHTIPL